MNKLTNIDPRALSHNFKFATHCNLLAEEQGGLNSARITKFNSSKSKVNPFINSFLRRFVCLRRTSQSRDNSRRNSRKNSNSSGHGHKNKKGLPLNLNIASIKNPKRAETREKPSFERTQNDNKTYKEGNLENLNKDSHNDIHTISITNLDYFKNQYSNPTYIRTKTNPTQSPEITINSSRPLIHMRTQSNTLLNHIKRAQTKLNKPITPFTSFNYQIQSALKIKQASSSDSLKPKQVKFERNNYKGSQKIEIKEKHDENDISKSQNNKTESEFKSQEQMTEEERKIRESLYIPSIGNNIKDKESSYAKFDNEEQFSLIRPHKKIKRFITCLKESYQRVNDSISDVGEERDLFKKYMKREVEKKIVQ